MPKVEDYYPFESATPEPRFIPGYTGYLPGYGPRRIYQMGNTLGQMSHSIMSAHPIAGLRLQPILDRSEVMAQEDTNRFYTWRHENTTDDVKLRNHMIPGYAGYVPRKIFSIGKGLDATTQESVGQFERLQEGKFQHHGPTKYLARNPMEWEVPEKKPHSLRIEVPLYAGYLNVGNYMRNPMLDTSFKNRYKEYEPDQLKEKVCEPVYPEILPRHLKGFILQKHLPQKI